MNNEHTSMMRQARLETGIARFERECRTIQDGQYRRKAYRVPGTSEAGKHAMLQVATRDAYARLMNHAK